MQKNLKLNDLVVGKHVVAVYNGLRYIRFMM